MFDGNNIIMIQIYVNIQDANLYDQFVFVICLLAMTKDPTKAV